MSSILLMVSRPIRYPSNNWQEEEKKDVGSCLNCKRQGTGSDVCSTCSRDKYALSYRLTGDHFVLK